MLGPCSGSQAREGGPVRQEKVPEEEDSDSAPGHLCLYSEGWEQNGLYEFFRAKMRARRRKGQEKRNR